MDKPTFSTVPALWPNSTIVCIASGPSLTAEDCAFVRGKARVIVINTSYQLAPWADVLYACDWRWWEAHKGAPDFPGLKYALQYRAQRWPGVQLLKRGPNQGLSTDPGTLHLGQNSGYQAINLAVHFGATRIVLLGYDMTRGPQGEKHWHPDHVTPSPDDYAQFRYLFRSLEAPLRARGIEVLNCTRRTKLTTFPCVPLEQALPVAVAA